MSYSVYRMREGRLQTGIAPGGALMELGATESNGTHMSEIVVIDRDRQMYRRRGWPSERRFPAKWYRADDITWIWEPLNAVGQGK